MSKGYQAYADALLTSEPSGENAAVLQHIGLVHKTALHIKARLPDHVELEELVQIGMVGLLEAAKSFDASQGSRSGHIRQQAYPRSDTRRSAQALPAVSNRQLPYQGRGASG